MGQLFLPCPILLPPPYAPTFHLSPRSITVPHISYPSTRHHSLHPVSFTPWPLVIHYTVYALTPFSTLLFFSPFFINLQTISTIRTYHPTLPIAFLLPSQLYLAPASSMYDTVLTPITISFPYTFILAPPLSTGPSAYPPGSCSALQLPPSRYSRWVMFTEAIPHKRWGGVRQGFCERKILGLYRVRYILRPPLKTLYMLYQIFLHGAS